MEKEKVTEELVRQNGNQAAAVMADYAGQGGSGGSTGGQIVPNLSIDWGEGDHAPHAVLSRWPQAGDILVVPLNVSTDVGDERYVLLVYIDETIPESEFQVGEFAGYASIIGLMPGKGNFIHDAINSNSGGWHLWLTTTPTDGVYAAGIVLVNK